MGQKSDKMVARNVQGISDEEWARLKILMEQIAKGKSSNVDEHLPPTWEPATWVLYDIWRRFKVYASSQNHRNSKAAHLMEALRASFQGKAGGAGGSMITPIELLQRLEAIAERADGLNEAQREDYMYSVHPAFLEPKATFNRQGRFTTQTTPRLQRKAHRRAAAPLLETPPSITQLEEAIETLSRAQATLSTASLLRTWPRQYIETCKPAFVYEATGALRWSLEPVARTILSSLVNVRFFCVDRLDWSVDSGADCPSPEVVQSYFSLPKPYIVLLDRNEAIEAIKMGSVGIAKRLDFNTSEPYVPILAAVDADLPPQTSDLLAAMNEVVSAQMGKPISGSTTSLGRHDARVAPAEAYGPLYPDEPLPRKKAVPLKGVLPSPNMYASLFRYARQGNHVGARVDKGVVQDQQAACAVALVDRESQEIIMPYMRPAAALLAGRAAPSGVGLTVGGLAIGCKLVTLGGWGNQVHTDDTDAGGQAFIIMYARGDLSRIRGGWFLLPGCHLHTTPGRTTLYYVASSLILHNTVPHTASEYARIVGTSLHMNHNLKVNFSTAMTAPQWNSTTVGALALLSAYGHEKHISQETKEKYPVVKETLKKVIKKKPLHGDRWT